MINIILIQGHNDVSIARLFGILFFNRKFWKHSRRLSARKTRIRISNKWASKICLTDL